MKVLELLRRWNELQEGLAEQMVEHGGLFAEGCRVQLSLMARAGGVARAIELAKA